MKEYFAYVRVSTARQGEKGTSLEEQRAAIKEYAARQGLKIKAWYEEKETAAKGGRPLFLSLLKALSQGKATGVITHRIDRSARNLKDWADLGVLIDQGLEVHFAHENVDLTSRGGRLAADIQAVVAADFIRNLRDEVKKGFYGRLKQGIYPLRAPLGYLDQGGGKSKAIDSVSGPLVKLGFELYAAGDWSFERLGEELYKRGLRNKAGKRLSLNGISTFLNNPFYYGIIRLKKTGETFQGNHEPLIEESLFKRVQAVLRRQQPHKVKVHRYRYQRFITCQTCGRCLIAETQKGHVYYRCHTKSCPLTSLREEEIDAVIRGSTMQFQFSKEEWRLINAEVDAVLSEGYEQDRVTLQSIALAKTAIDDRLNRLTDAYLDKTVDRDLYLMRKEALLDERASLLSKERELAGGLVATEQRLRTNLELVEALGCLVDLGSDQEFRETLKQATSNLSASGKYVAVTWQNPLGKAAVLPLVPSCELHRGKPRTARRRRIRRMLEEFSKYPCGPEGDDIARAA
ncbi:MAG: recombinase family protein [Rhodovibrionaceae bacterium]